MGMAFNFDLRLIGIGMVHAWWHLVNSTKRYAPFTDRELRAARPLSRRCGDLLWTACGLLCLVYLFWPSRSTNAVVKQPRATRAIREKTFSMLDEVATAGTITYFVLSIVPWDLVGGRPTPITIVSLSYLLLTTCTLGYGWFAFKFRGTELLKGQARVSVYQQWMA